MQLSRLIDAMEQLAPTRHAEAWDNVGLLAGDPAQEISGVLLTIDYTKEVADEGRGLGCDAVVAYHPPIFQAIKRLTAGGVVFDAIRRGVAIYSPHTALDVADGGTNDVLCDILGLADRHPLKLAETKATHCKFVTFVPHEAVETVCEALFAAGAGHIGKYSSCSFRTSGMGTFFGEEGTHPAVGVSGRHEHASEMKVETVVPLGRVADVIAALKKSHPYEEPAFDLHQLLAAPEGVGIGRIGQFAEPVEREQLFDRLRRGLGLSHLLIAGPQSGKAARAAVCAGACGDLLNDGLAQKADVYVTGEVRHHDAIKAAAAGMTVVCTLHSNSERVTLTRLKERLEKSLPGLPIHLSQVDRDPFSIR